MSDFFSLAEHPRAHYNLERNEIQVFPCVWRHTNPAQEQSVSSCPLNAGQGRDNTCTFHVAADGSTEELDEPVIARRFDHGDLIRMLQTLTHEHGERVQRAMASVTQIEELPQSIADATCATCREAALLLDAEKQVVPIRGSLHSGRHGFPRVFDPSGAE